MMNAQKAKKMKKVSLCFSPELPMQTDEGWRIHNLCYNRKAGTDE